MKLLIDKIEYVISALQEIKAEMGQTNNGDSLYNEKGQRLIDASQQEEIRYLTRDYPDVFNNMMGYLGFQKLGDMPRKDYRRNIERLRAVIETKEQLKRPIVQDD